MYCTGTSAEGGTYFAILKDTRAFAGDETHLTFTDSSHNALVFDRPGAVPVLTDI